MSRKWRWLLGFVMIVAVLFMSLSIAPKADACDRTAFGFTTGYSAYSSPATLPAGLSVDQFGNVFQAPLPQPTPVVQFTPIPVNYGFPVGFRFGFTPGVVNFHGVGFDPRFQFVNRGGVVEPVRHFHLVGFPKFR